MKNKKEKKYRTGFLKILQHILITAAVIAGILLISGSVVVVNRYDGREMLTQSQSDVGRKYGDSVLFNTVMGYETSDVLRLVTIRTQMETDATYDPDKVIDISSYNNRHAGGYSSDDSITAQYRLGDLLKWKKYDFETETVNADRTVTANMLASYSDDMNASSAPEGAPFEREILVNRYKTVDGKTLEECVSDWSEYDRLTEELITCADDLYVNYTDYLGLSSYFDALNSNIRYLVVMGQGKDATVYTNTDITNTLNDSDIRKVFAGYGRYISYDSDSMMYKTNTAITESAFNTLISEYRYAFPDDSRIYIGVDMKMPVDDCIASAGRNYSIVFPYRNELMIALIICILLYLILLVICTMREGRIVDENGVESVRFTGFDHTPIELWIVLVGFVAAVFVFGIMLLYDHVDIIHELANLQKIPYLTVAGVIVFVLDIIILGLYYSLVRRIRGRHIWKQSLLYRLIMGCRRGLYGIYDNGSVLVRSVVPYTVLLLINLLLIIFALAMRYNPLIAWAAVMTAVIFDIAAGIFIYHQVADRDRIMQGMKKIISGDLGVTLDSRHVHGDNAELAECVNSISDSVRNAVEQSMKDERMKTELVANVSHDIRTPLTSIINYVDLLKREDIRDETVRGYIDVLDEKSQRLKTLADDLIEASKVSSGNVEMELVRINLPEMLSQAVGEFSDKLEDKELTLVTRADGLTRPQLMADGRNLWRVMENLLENVCKYAMPGTRVFVDLFNITQDNTDRIALRITNMSAAPLPADLSELSERFIRGDESRSSEGSGLGLSIAKTLTELMGGTFVLTSDADLFKAEITFEAVD